MHARHLPSTPLATRVGDPYNPANQSLSLEQLSGLFEKDQDGNAALNSFLGRIPAASYTAACTRILPPADCITLVHQAQCVQVVFSRYAIGLDLELPATFAPPAPRSPFASFLAGVPAALKVLNPTAGLTSDDRLGTSPSGTTHIDLLSLPALLAGQPAAQRPVALGFAAAGSHALQHNLYSASEQLTLGLNLADTTRPQFSVHVARLDSRQPLGTATDQLGSTTAGLELTLHPAVADFALFSAFRDETHSAAAERNSLTTFVADTHRHGLLTRSALWFSADFPSQLPAYQRLVFSTSAYKDIPLRTNQSIGLQLGVSTGATWGSAPVYAEFYPGNNPTGFLFSDRQTLLTQAPAGPTLRSLGTAEGARNPTAPAAGSFAGITSTVSFPVPRWSRPLIPNVDVTDTITLKQLLVRSATVTNKNLLASSLEQRGMSRAEAQKEASRIIATEVAPTVEYIANQANIYSIKADPCRGLRPRPHQLRLTRSRPGAYLGQHSPPGRLRSHLGRPAHHAPGKLLSPAPIPQLLLTRVPRSTGSLTNTVPERPQSAGVPVWTRVPVWT